MDIARTASGSGLHAVSGASASASRGAPPRQKMSSLFDSIDISGSGTITRAQFDQAFATKNPPAVFREQGADAIFAELDPNGTGSVSKRDFVLTMSSLMVSLRSESSARSISRSADSLSRSVQSLDHINFIR